MFKLSIIFDLKQILETATIDYVPFRVYELENEPILDIYLENVLSFDLNESLFSNEIINLNNFTFLSNNITFLNCADDCILFLNLNTLLEICLDIYTIV